MEKLGRALAKVIFVSNEHDMTATVPVNRLIRNDDCLVLLAEDDAPETKRIGPQVAIRIGQIHAYLDGPRLMLGRRADPAHRTLDFAFVPALGAAEQDLLSWLEIAGILLSHI